MIKNPKTHSPKCSPKASHHNVPWGPCVGEMDSGQPIPFLPCNWGLSAWTIAHLIAECFLHWTGKRRLWQTLLLRVQLSAELTFLQISLLSGSPEVTPILVVYFFYVPCSRLAIKQAIEGTFWFHGMCHHRGVESWVVISRKISYLSLPGMTAPNIQYLSVLSALTVIIAFFPWWISCYFRQPLS